MTTHDLIARLRHYIDSLAPPMAKRYIQDAIRELKTLQRERDDLKHDVERHIAIASEEAMRADDLRRERDEAVLFADRYKFLRRRAVMVDYGDDTTTKVTLFKEEGPTGEFLDDWVDGEIAAISTLTKPADGEAS